MSDKNRKIKIYKRWALLLLIAVVIIFTTAKGIFALIGYFKPTPSVYPKTVNGVPVYTDLVDEGLPGRPGNKKKIMYLVIHETDNTAKGADAQNHNTYIHEAASTQRLSWHYTVDDEKIYHHIPDDEIAFHAGDSRKSGGGNMNGVGIELCVNKDGDFEQTLENGAKLVAYLLKQYDLNIEDVKKHQDFSGKICPSTLINDGRWEEFLDKIQKYF